MRLVWCGLYDGAAYLSTSESYLRDLGVVRLIHVPRAAYSPEITVHVYIYMWVKVDECRLMGRTVSVSD